MARLFFTVLMLYIVDSEWQGQILPILPMADSYMATGTYNNTIYIIGGEQHYAHFHVIKYIIANNIFVDDENYPDDYSGIYGYAQFYTQQSDHLYFIKPTVSNDFTSTIGHIALYNLKTQTYDPNWKEITSIVPHHNGCLTSTDQYLILIGATSDATIVLLFHLTDYIWLLNAKHVSTGRHGAACVVNSQNDIYVVGGQQDVCSNDSDDWAALSTIETNNIDDITENEWSYIDNLSVAVTRARAVIYNEFIYVIGGINGTKTIGYTQYPEGAPMSIVQVINTKTGITSVSSSTVPWSVVGCAIVVVDDIIYVFGGESGKYFDYLNIWTYNVLLSKQTDTTYIGEDGSTNKNHSDYLGIGMCFGILIGIVISITALFVWNFYRKILLQRETSVLDSKLLDSNDTSQYSADSIWNAQSDAF